MGCFRLKASPRRVQGHEAPTRLENAIHVLETIDRVTAQYNYTQEILASKSDSYAPELQLIHASLEKCLQVLKNFNDGIEKRISARLDELMRCMEKLTRDVTENTTSDSVIQFHSESNEPPLHEEGLIPERHQNTPRASSAMYDEQEQQRVNILSKMHAENPSIDLQAYFDSLKKASPSWDIDADRNTFIGALEFVASVIGLDTVKYFGKTLKGIHFSKSFKESFNETYPECPITTKWDLSLVCPPSWSYEIIEAGMVLTYRGAGPLRAFFNDATYHERHPGGVNRLENVVEFDGYAIVFKPGARNILSRLELEEELRQAYNAPRDSTDEEQLSFYESFPESEFPRLGKSYGTLAVEAKLYADRTLSEADWENNRDTREKRGQGKHLNFNFERLHSCFMEVEHAHLTDEDIFSRAKTRKSLHEFGELESWLEGVLIQIRRQGTSNGTEIDDSPSRTMPTHLPAEDAIYVRAST
ncbi:hypothetical protein O988_08802 [Pseudogymnoascus sp. VKM F-3808]|nr:hypothetical protein O988_08802 [Pseudogymnoascus sp. VKM F-3808]